jgi:hypothetical protein
MWGRTCIPRKVYQVLFPFKRDFCCVQAQHFLVFWWLVVALIRDPGKGTLRGLGTYLPSKLNDWTCRSRILISHAGHVGGGIREPTSRSNHQTTRVMAASVAAFAARHWCEEIASQSTATWPT